ncbi:MAG: tRNA (adenine(22)-N(1))-methyltransferase TrmK [Bacilli bacterium]|nr:tRNA (adenine(22)-N(1))-methyltransferase TrmK [Bacilli bacterium]
MMRLEYIATLIPPYTRFADIGCDHGYLIAHAFGHGINFAQAIDNKVGPLENAKRNLKDYQGQVLFTLDSGLNALDSSIECVVFAGLGGRLIVDLLKEQETKLPQISRIIVEPHKNIHLVRKYLSTHGYKIVLEKAIEEESIFYEIIVFEKGSSNYTEDELTFGPLLLKEKDPIFIKKWLKVHQELSGNPHPMAIAKKLHLEAILDLKGESHDYS